MGGYPIMGSPSLIAHSIDRQSSPEYAQHNKTVDCVPKGVVNGKLKYTESHHIWF